MTATGRVQHNYAIDLQTNGGAFQTVINTSVSGKKTSGYERSHRINFQPVPQRGRFACAKLRQMQTAQKSATR
jgi:predicted phage tail protein